MAQLTITATGLAKAAEAQQTGTQVKLERFKLSNSPSNDDEMGTVLFESVISKIELDPDNADTVIAKCLLPSGLQVEDVFHKCFIYDAEGDLFAYGRINSFAYTMRADLEAEINIYLTFSAADSIRLAAPVEAYVDVETFEAHQHDERYHLKDYLNQVFTTFANINHLHDERYYLKAEVDNKDKALENLINYVVSKLPPIGEIIAFAGTNPPANYLECNGIYLARANYAALFNAIGTTYGATDSFNFRIPDLRGEFIRGWDHGRGVDGGRWLGSFQYDELRRHNHINGVFSNLLRPPYPGSLTGSDAEGSGSEQAVGPGDSQGMADTGGNETRPRNIALMYCIRFQ